MAGATWNEPAVHSMRPRGEVRQALFSAALELLPVQGACTWRELAAVAQVGCVDARRAVENMTRSGELVRTGSQRRADGAGWVGLYEPAPPLVADDDQYAPLAFVLGSWPRESIG